MELFNIFSGGLSHSFQLYLSTLIECVAYLSHSFRFALIFLNTNSMKKITSFFTLFGYLH